MEEVLDRRPAGTLNFLLQTSVLDRLCGPLCDAVIGGKDSQALLQKLEHANLFIVPLDDEGKWYRYHHLFGEVLHSHWHATGEDKPAELHVRAAGWFESNGLIVDAIHHALAAKDWERSIRLIMDVADTVTFTQGQFRTMLAWP